MIQEGIAELKAQMDALRESDEGRGAERELAVAATKMDEARLWLDEAERKAEEVARIVTIERYGPDSPNLIRITADVDELRSVYLAELLEDNMIFADAEDIVWHCYAANPGMPELTVEEVPDAASA